MEKAILMSIRPKYVADILNGKKTIEIRKKFPKDYVGWVYIYCTKEREIFYKIENGKRVYSCYKNRTKSIYKGRLSNGVVVARFWCDKVEEIAKEDYYPSSDLMSATMWYEFHTKTMDEEQILEKSCLSKSELHNYLNFKRGYAVHITKLEIFDKPKEISEFKQLKSERVFNNLSWLKPNEQLRFGNLVPLTRAPQSWCYVEV